MRMLAAHVLEPDTPDWKDPLDWLPLTTKGESAKKNSLCLAGKYERKWLIKEWHQTLKSGCRAETIAHRTGMHIERVVAIVAVIA